MTFSSTLDGTGLISATSGSNLIRVLALHCFLVALKAFKYLDFVPFTHIIKSTISDTWPLLVSFSVVLFACCFGFAIALGSGVWSATFGVSQLNNSGWLLVGFVVLVRVTGLLSFFAILASSENSIQSEISPRLLFFFDWFKSWIGSWRDAEREERLKKQRIKRESRERELQPWTISSSVSAIPVPSLAPLPGTADGEVPDEKDFDGQSLSLGPLQPARLLERRRRLLSLGQALPPFTPSEILDAASSCKAQVEQRIKSTEAESAEELSVAIDGLQALLGVVQVVGSRLKDLQKQQGGFVNS